MNLSSNWTPLTMPRPAASPAPHPNAISLELAFTAANTLALVAWSLLVARTHVANNARPNNRDELLKIAKVTRLAEQGVRFTAIVFAVAYFGALAAYVVTSGVGVGVFGSFSSLQGIKSLFANDVVLLGGWLHYLAFDLVVASHGALNEGQYGVPRALTIGLSLPLSFIAGPVGYLCSRCLVRVYSRRTTQ
ncbi:uncharacterized protein MICPUCDRAFT_68783 [Micromonas pusilla CCMP1545]|uniref:Predicted protein n=1 Tax=Micromonas pusilla (strain CCMP1545) TaxID=564608 RepID=C1N3Z4_MICPC|nr:uncharacterized protein MICPUCDRAFT_68783 [Micromonas pusilla CCMP1545]EEH53521.1 predicted protein [Micromonas pusilla CCMP1545]|eukprot:XP_003062702.1 predicted protein [Micromonas pusilla CCMP1545]